MVSKREARRSVAVTIGSRNLPLNPYVQDVFSEVTLALIGTLKKADQPEFDSDAEITITISSRT